jgi:hypothetical protein
MGGVHTSVGGGIQVDLQYRTVDQLQRSIWQADLRISPGPTDPSMQGSAETHV